VRRGFNSLSLRERVDMVWAETAERLEHEPPVVLEERVREGQLAAVLEQECVHVTALAVPEAVDARRELRHARVLLLPGRFS
jgi:hypothetical protein